MTNATRTRKPQARSAKVQTIGDAIILWLTTGELTTAYRVIPIPHGFGKAAFRLAKADKGDGPAEEYDVLLDGQLSMCDCRGFARHGMKAHGGIGCKHIAGCQAALDAGQLHAASKPAPAPATPVQVAPSPKPEPKPACCTLCGGSPVVEGEGLCRDCLCPF